MSDNEKLIEEAAKAMYFEDCGVAALSDDAEPFRDMARIALAVFEKVHPPTDDERVARLMARVTPLGYASALALIEAETRMLAESNEAARRSEVPGPRAQIGCPHWSPGRGSGRSPQSLPVLVTGRWWTSEPPLPAVPPPGPRSTPDSRPHPSHKPN